MSYNVAEPKRLGHTPEAKSLRCDTLKMSETQKVSGGASAMFLCSLKAAVPSRVCNG